MANFAVFTRSGNGRPIAINKARVTFVSPHATNPAASTVRFEKEDTVSVDASFDAVVAEFNGD